VVQCELDILDQQRRVLACLALHGRWAAVD
jgi:hypothetical protein